MLNLNFKVKKLLREAKHELKVCQQEHEGKALLDEVEGIIYTQREVTILEHMAYINGILDTVKEYTNDT